MSPTTWAELTAVGTSYQPTGLGPLPTGTVDFIFGCFALTQGDFLAETLTPYTELTAPSTSHTELTVPAPNWTEISG